MAKLIVRQIRVDEELFDKIGELAEKDDRPWAAQVRYLVKWAINEKERREQQEN